MSDDTSPEESNGKARKDVQDDNTCFVILPISDPDGYEKGHFERVYRDIIEPACEMAGFEAIRANDVKQTNLIHLDILSKLLESPMAVCDLSGQNPNVLFELGLRQAFDKPVALVKDDRTDDIFDIASLRYREYRSARVYHEVVKDQQHIAELIRSTREAFAGDDSKGINSIVKLLSLERPASLKDLEEVEKNPAYQLLREEIDGLRQEVRRALPTAQPARKRLVRQMSIAKEAVGVMEVEEAYANMLNELNKELNKIESFVLREMPSDVELRVASMRVRLVEDNLEFLSGGGLSGILDDLSLSPSLFEKAKQVKQRAERLGALIADSQGGLGLTSGEDEPKHNP